MSHYNQGVVAMNADGRIEYFVPAAEGGFRHRWQNLADDGMGGWGSLASQWLGTTVGEVNIAGWSEWGYVGGPVPAGGIAVARNADGRLEVYLRADDGGLYHTWQREASGAFGEWHRFVGGWPGRPACGTNADSRVEVFMIG